MEKIAQTLVDYLEHEAEQIRFVIEKSKNTSLQYSPGSGLRPLIELINHAVQIPAMDRAIYSGEIDSMEKAQTREKDLTRDSIDGMLQVFDSGLESLIKMVTSLSDEEMMKRQLQPFYETGSKKNWAFCLHEIVSHLAMHKMQIWMYLKLGGQDVNMFTYYGIEPGA